MASLYQVDDLLLLFPWFINFGLAELSTAINLAIDLFSCLWSQDFPLHKLSCNQSIVAWDGSFFFFFFFVFLDQGSFSFSPFLDQGSFSFRPFLDQGSFPFRHQFVYAFLLAFTQLQSQPVVDGFVCCKPETTSHIIAWRFKNLVFSRVLIFLITYVYPHDDVLQVLIFFQAIHLFSIYVYFFSGYSSIVFMKREHKPFIVKNYYNLTLLLSIYLSIYLLNPHIPTMG